MPISQPLQDSLEQISQQAPLWLDVIVGFAGLWGVFLLLFGRRLVKPSLAMTGLLIGALAAGLIGRQFVTGNQVLIFVIGGGVVGMLVAWVMYRFWMAVILAAMLALAVPWGVLAWHGAPPSPIEQRVNQVKDPNFARNLVDANAIADRFSIEVDDNGGPRIVEGSDEGEQGDNLLDRAGQAASDLGSELIDWWNHEVSSTVRWTAMTAAAIVLIAGFVVGLIMPELAASLATSLVGTAFVVVALSRLGGQYVPVVERWLPEGPRGLLLVMAAITAVGTLLQWTVLRPRRD